MPTHKKALSAAIAFAVLAGASFSASAKTVLKLSHNQDRATPVHKSMQFMADEVKKLTDGDLIVRIYPNGQLGSQRESMELLQNGALDMAKSNASELESFEPSYGAFNIPYIFRDRDHYYRSMQGKVGQDILKSSKDKGFVGLTYFDGGSRSFYSNKEIQTPADLKGMKIRVQPSPTAVKMVKLLGGSPTPLAYGELYTALQQGVVDGAENNTMALTNARHGEVAKVYSLDEHTMIPDVLVISTNSWDKLSATQQKALKEAADKSMMFMKDLWTETMEVENAKAKKMGVKYVTVDKQSFVDAVKPMHDEAKQNPAIGEYVESIYKLVK